MLKRLKIPLTEEGKKLFLPREHLKSGLVLYRETESGLEFAGLYDPFVPDYEYADGIIAVPLRAVFTGINSLSAGVSVSKVYGDTANVLLAGSKKNEDGTWSEIYKTIIYREFGVTTSIQIDSDPAEILGVHITEAADNKDHVYLLPINIGAAEITKEVYAIEVKSTLNGVLSTNPETEGLTGVLPVTEGASNGIDVSVHNGAVDFEKVKASGISFVMIREGYGSDGLYPDQVDIRYADNYINAKKAKLLVGAYHYLYAKTILGAIEEAQGFIANLKGKQFEMPVALDIEDAVQSGLPNDTVSGMIIAFMNECEKAGYYCCLYSYERFLKSKVYPRVLGYYSVWCANISKRPEIEHGIHQYSFTGSVDGLTGNVDLDCSYVDYPSIIISGGFNGYPKPNKV